MGPATEGLAVGVRLERFLTELDPLSRSLLREAPLLGPSACLSLGVHGLLEQILGAGLDVESHGDGWWRMAPQHASLFEHADPLSPAVRADLVQCYLDAGEVLVALEFLQRTGQSDDWAATVARTSVEALDRADLHHLVGVLENSPGPVGPDHVRAHLVILDAAALRLDRGCMARCLELIAAHRPGPSAHDPALEEAVRLAELRLASLELDDAADAGRVIAAAARLADHALDPLVRVKAGVVDARVSAWLGRDRRRAESLLLECSGALQVLDQRAERVNVLLLLGWNIHYSNSNLDQSIRVMSEAYALATGLPRQQAIVGTFLGHALAMVGDESAAEVLTAALQTGQELADHQVAAYAAWSLAWIADQEGDHEACERWATTTELYPGSWYASRAGVEFVVDRVQWAIHRGDLPAARRHLATARTLVTTTSGHPAQLLLGEGAIAGAEGEVDTAIAAYESWLTIMQEHGQRWRCQVHIAALRLARGDLAGARKDAVEVSSYLAAIDRPELAHRWEGERWPALAELVERPPGPRVTILDGDVRVHVGQHVEPAGGRAAALLFLLVTHDRPLSVSRLGDLLWPDEAAEITRTRLRNVLARTPFRHEVVRRDGENVTLVPSVSSDWRELVRDLESARRALRLGRVEIADLTRLVGRWPDTVAIPPGLDGGDEPVLAAERTAIALHESLTEMQIAAGDLVGALTTVERLVRLDPWHTSHLDKAAELALALGQPAAAERFTRRAIELGP